MSAAQRELAAVRAQDRADRNFSPLDLDKLTKSQYDSLEAAVSARDAARRVRVRELMTQKAARTAADYENAAVVLQHGNDPADYLLAHGWAGVAIGLDDKAPGPRYLFAATWDRFMASQDRPQWYGTNVNRRADGFAELHPVDTLRVSDVERKRLTGWTLQERRASVEQLNAQMRPRK